MQPGDLLVLYTDGLTEATNPDDEEFGVERLAGVVCASRKKTVKEIEIDLLAALASFVKASRTRTTGRSSSCGGSSFAQRPRRAARGATSRASMPWRFSISFSVVGLRPRSSAARFWTPLVRSSAAARSARSYASRRPGTRDLGRQGGGRGTERRTASGAARRR